MPSSTSSYPVVITSDGTPEGTKVLVGGCMMRGVQSVAFSVVQGQKMADATIVVRGAQIDEAVVLQPTVFTDPGLASEVIHYDPGMETRMT